MRPQIWPTLYIIAGWLICLAIVFTPLLLGGSAARAQPADHEARLAWIHQFARNCCDHNDCKPTRMTWTFTGWQAEGARNVVPFAQVIRWPFAGPYACIVNGHARWVMMNGGS